METKLTVQKTTQTTKNRKFLVMDTGIFCDLASCLGKNGDNVSYWTDYSADFAPRYSNYAKGKGLENIEKVLYDCDYYDDADCIVNFDVAGNDFVAWYKKHFDKPVFGSGMGERLENSRWELKKLIKSLGLDVNKPVRVQGVTELQSYIKAHPDKYVKIDIFRGSTDSFYAKDIGSIKAHIKKLIREFSPDEEEIYFVVEDAIPDAVEIGYDGFFNGVDYIDFVWGIEYAKDSYIGRVGDIPKQLRRTMEALKPELQKRDWRGAISTEERITKNKHYLIDICARFPSPLGILHGMYIENFPEVVHAIASKQMVKPITKFKYCGCVPIYSPEAKVDWVEVNFDYKYRSNIRFMSACRAKDGKFYARDEKDGLIAIVVGAGNTVDEVIKELEKYADKIEAYGLEKSALGGLREIRKIISDMSALGIDF